MNPTFLRRLTFSLATGALLALVPRQAPALTVPVAEDSSSNPAGKISTASGKAPTLAIDATQTTLLRFDLNDLAVVPGEFQPGNIKSATLRLYLVNAKFAAPVTVHAVTSDWHENAGAVPVALPTIDPAVLATIPAADLVAKSFVSVDLTAPVIAALTSGSTFGFALQTTDPAAKIKVASKEGTATGFPAELDIEANTGVDGMGNLAGNSGTFSTLTVSTAFTVQARPNNAGGFDNFIGINAGAANTTGSGDTFIGYSAGGANQNGSNNTFIGLSAGASNVSGSLNTFIGQGAGGFSSSGNNNNFIGQAAGFNNSSGSGNNFFGYHAGFNNGAATNNTAIGDQAGANNTASSNTFVGSGAGLLNGSGSSNVFVGAGSGATNVTGNQNSFFGINAGKKSTANFNTFFGAGAGQATTLGAGNTAIGNIAGLSNTTGSNNAFLGGNTGTSNTTESYNTFVGDSTNSAPGTTNSTAVGSKAYVSASNSLVLGSINGQNGAASDTFVGIRTTAPNSTLQVNGSLSLPVQSAVNTALVGLGDNDYVLIISGTTATTVILPQPAVAGRVYVVKNRATVAAIVGFQSGGSLIEGAATLIVPSGSVAHVICDGSNWFKIN